LRFENITLKLGGQLILQQFSLSLEPGQITCIMGRSGLGKTTLLRLAARLQQPDQGRVVQHQQGEEVFGMEGQDKDEQGKDEYGKEENDAKNVGARGLKAKEVQTRAGHEAVGYVFQEPRLLPWRTILDNVQWVLKDRMDGASRRAAAQDMLEAVGLGAAMSAFPHELSGGMRQRVAIARAFAMQPSLLLLDEPFQSLDVSKRRLMQQLLVRQWLERRPTVVFVTHDLDEALAVGQHIVLLDGSPMQAAMRLSAGWLSDGGWCFRADHTEALRQRIYDTNIEGSGQLEASRVAHELGRHRCL
jgi:ABC-type nitrate/sulfonate/bicarbonate transport system ATPase subunit